MNKEQKILLEKEKINEKFKTIRTHRIICNVGSIILIITIVLAPLGIITLIVSNMLLNSAKQKANTKN